MEANDRLESSLGFLGMFGGALFGLLLIVWPLLLDESSAIAGAEAVWSMIMLSLVFLIPGAIGLYLAQRDAFGLLSRVATVLFVGGLLVAFVTGTLGLFVDTLPYAEQFWLVTLALFYFAGPITFGAATARADVLAHGRAGGVLLAVSLPGAMGLLYAIDWLGASIPDLLGFAIFGLPYALAWLVLGYDLLVIASPDADDVPTPSADD